MLDHHIQRAIVYKLALASSMRFSELKPDNIENKLFNYHLKKTLSAGYVEKSDDGTYALTPEGRRLGVHVLDNTQALIDRAYSVLLLVVRRKSNKSWLLYKRKNHPLMDRVGFMHATPNANEPIVETAKKTCLEMAGIKANFEVRGNGFFRVYDKDNLESFTHFTLLASEDGEGELIQKDELAEYFWVDEIDTNDPKLLPNMPLLLQHYESKEQFFIDETIKL